MPSGSHGHGGGSHFSGGGTGGFFAFWRTPVTRGRPIITGPRIIFIGGRRYQLGSTRQVLIVMLTIVIFIMLMLGFCGFAVVSDANKDLDTIKSDYEYYQDMISYAESHDGYIVEGTVTDRFTGDGFSKYYITYTITTESGGLLEGYSFHVYTLEDLNNLGLTRGATISIAVDTNPVDFSTDSIPLDYKNTKLEDDEEYTQALSTSKSGKVMIGVAIVVALLSIGGIVLAIVTSKKASESVSDTNLKDTSSEPKRSYCSYCGSEMSEEQLTCPNCGAKRKKG